MPDRKRPTGEKPARRTGKSGARKPGPKAPAVKRAEPRRAAAAGRAKTGAAKTGAAKAGGVKKETSRGARPASRPERTGAPARPAAPPAGKAPARTQGSGLRPAVPAAEREGAGPLGPSARSRAPEKAGGPEAGTENGSVAARSKRLPPKRVRADDEHYRVKLLASRAAILKNLEELREELRGLQEPSHELEEWAQEEKDRDILIRLELREKEELSRIQGALTRLEEGTYGQCARCGRRISKERLEEVPTAIFCRNCQPS